jgi:hypothetical protein
MVKGLGMKILIAAGNANSGLVRGVGGLWRALGHRVQG